MCQRRGCVNLYTEWDVLGVPPSVSVAHRSTCWMCSTEAFYTHFYMLCAQPVLTHCISTWVCWHCSGWNEQNEAGLFRRRLLSDVDKPKEREAQCANPQLVFARCLPALCFHRGEGILQVEWCLELLLTEYSRFESVCVHLNHRPKGVPAWEELGFALCERWWIILQLQWI